MLMDANTKSCLKGIKEQGVGSFLLWTVNSELKTRI